MLRDHPKEYRDIEKLIEENKVQQLASYLADLTRNGCYVLGPHTFSPNGFDPPHSEPPFDPKRSEYLKLTMQSLVMIACHHPHQSPDVITLLLSRKFRKHVKLNKCEWYYHQLHSWSCVAPLHVACTGYSQNLTLVKTLVRLGADVNLKTACCGQTPLHLALTSYGTEEAVDIVRYLIGRGAKVNATDACGNTPLALLLHRGEKSKKEELASVLFSRRLKVNILNTVGFGALHYAAFHNEAWAVKRLLSKGASPMFNTEDSRKYKPTSPLFLTSSEEVAKMFTSKFSCPLSCKIDSLLLVGASERARHEKQHKRLWEEALALREGHGIFPSEMHNIGKWKEMRAVNELREQIRRASDGLPVAQIVLVQERCLGYFGDLGVLKEIANQHTNFFSEESVRTHFFRRMIHCLKNTSFPHWLISIETHWKRELACFTHAVNFATRVVCRPYKKEECSLEDSGTLEQFADLCIDLLEALEYNYTHMLCTKGITRTKELNEFIWSLLNIFVSWYRLLYAQGMVSEHNALQPLKDSIQKLVNRNVLFLGTTLLHFFPGMFIKSRHTMDVYELILQTDGVEPYVNLVSKEGHRPLHCVAMSPCKRNVSYYTRHYDEDQEEEEDERSSLERMVSLILSLVENGAHLDAVNGQGYNVWNYSTDLYQLLPPAPRPLACIAAVVIVRDIPYQLLDSVPPRLKHFLDLHNPDCCHEFSDCVAL